MRRAVQKQIGSLKTLTIEGAAGGPAVVLFHGYGADASDLIPLSDMMSLSSDVTWVFPDAPLEVIIAPGFTGKAWFPIDSKRLESGMTSGEPADLRNSTPPGLENARKQAVSLYSNLRRQHSTVVMGGFSQGAMLTLETVLSMGAAAAGSEASGSGSPGVSSVSLPDGIVLMSCGYICEDRWKAMAPLLSGQSFFQSHGRNDVLLGYDYADELFNMLTTAGWNGDFVNFNGGHEIPPKVIEKISSYISQIFVSASRRRTR